MAPQAGGDSTIRVLIVDDEPALRRSLARLLMSRGFETLTAEGGEAALSLLSTTRIDVMLCDLMMPKMDGMEVLRRVKSEHPQVEVVMMTAHGQLDTAVAAVRAGAYDFLQKPFAMPDAVAIALEKAVERRRLVDRARVLEERLEQHEKFGELVGSSSLMQEVYRVALGVAPSTSTILITGENGTGKELVARAIHQHSNRADKPLRVINCGAIPESLVETELFGSVRGAFTGALDRPGIFEMADKSTVFLDEIGDLPVMSQVSLLRALAQGEIRRVGSTETKKVDVRVIAATNVGLKARIAEGRFREDLFYRLNVIPIELPPLRKRREDIPLLAYHFLQKYCRRADKNIRRISVEALRALREHAWPGNVRELENTLEHAVVMARGDAILTNDLPLAKSPSVAGGEPAWAGAISASDACEMPYADAKDGILDAFDRTYVDRLLARTGGNVSEAARQAGMDRSNFRRLLKKARATAPRRTGDDGE